MSNKFIVAIDLGGTNLKIALFNSRYKIIARELLSTKKFRKSTLIQAIIKSVNKILREHRILRKSLLGVGLGVPGPINFKKGHVYFFPNISGWHNVPLRAILRKRLGLEVFLDNDANLMSLAEYRLGAAKGAENAVCLTLGTGVGGGVIINRQLYRGSGSVAGEIGHIPVNLTGPRCSCGGRACLEAYIGNSKIEKVADRLFKEKINLSQLSSLARKNNRKAIKVWEEVGSILGRALVGVVNLLNPDCIVVGGGVAGAGRVLFDKITEVIQGEAMPIHRRVVKVHRAKLGADAGLIGAALLVSENTR